MKNANKSRTLNFEKIEHYLYEEKLILDELEYRQLLQNFRAAYERRDSFEKSLQQAIDNLRTYRILLDIDKFKTNDCY